MQESYAKAVRDASVILTQAILETEPNLTEVVRELDCLLRRLLRETGRRVFEMLLQVASQRITSATQAEGLRVHRRKTVCFVGLFGPMQVESPYLYDPVTRRVRSGKGWASSIGVSARPWSGRSRISALRPPSGKESNVSRNKTRKRGASGFQVSRTTVLRVTEQQAAEAERFVQGRLAAERERFETQPTYVAQMASYPEIVSSLFSAAVSHGLSSKSPTLAVADGGNGLKEELELQFPNLTFILDRPHLQKRLYETAEAMGLVDVAREEWRRCQAERIDAGRVREVIAELRRYEGVGQERVLRLAGYLHRFRNCVHYDAYKERGFPIGSGEIESAHRSIPQRRLKLPGACWKPETIHPMLALRVLRANGWWQEFWEAKNVQ